MVVMVILLMAMDDVNDVVIVIAIRILETWIHG